MEESKKSEEYHIHVTGSYAYNSKNMSTRFLNSLTAALALLILPAVVLAQESTHASAELIANVSAIKAGEPFTVGLKIKIDPEWHVYWTNPGDSGLATKLHLTLPAGFSAGDVQYPVPERLVLPGDLLNYAYEGEVMLLVQITPPKQLNEKSITIGGRASWLVCKDACMPGGSKVSIDLPVQDSVTPANEDAFKLWQSRLPLATDPARVASVDSTLVKGAKPGTLDASATIHWKAVPTDVQFLPDAIKQGDASGIQVTTSGDTTKIAFTVKPDTLNEVHGLITYASADGQHVGLKTTVSAGH